MAKKAKKAKKVKEPKPKKAKKKKKSQGEGVNFKELCAKHVEKGLFGLAALLCLFLVYRGFQNREGIEPNRDPSKLDEQVSTVTRKVDEYSFENHFNDILEQDDKGFTERASKALKRLEADQFSNNQYLRPPISPPRTKRQDPQLLAATSLQVRPGFGILQRDQRINPERRNQNGEGQEREVDFGPAQIDEDELGDDYREMPRSMGGGRRGPEGGPRGGGRTGDGKGVYFVAVTGLVPVRAQLEEYQSKLLNSRGHDPGRDAPNYVNWVLERAEVSAPSQVGPFRRVAAYSRLNSAMNSGGFSREMGFRGGMEAEGADDFDPKFRDPVLTQAVPNVEVRDPKSLFVHDRIVELTAEEKQKELERLKELKEQGQIDPNDLFAGPEGNGFRPGGPREPGREPRFEQAPSFGDEGGAYGGDAYGGPRREGGFSSSRNSSLSGDMPLEKAPEVYMFRYVDTSVTPGRRYQYRLKLYIEDPNAPNDGNNPSPEELEPAVVNRLRDVKVPPSRQFFGRLTEASEPSPTIRIREGEEVLVETARPATMAIVPGTGQVYTKPGSEPLAKVMALKFDAERATSIPGATEVRRGSAVDFAEEVEVPLRNIGYLKKEKQRFRFETLVLDIRGGEERKLDFLSQPAELLVWDAAGNIKVLDELKDKELIEMNTFPEEERGSRRGEGFGSEGGDAYGGEGGRRREGGRREGGRRREG